MNELVYITGHRNPDTDSICSAIAYAELKKKMGIAAVPVRIGNINKETEFVLNRFEVELPEYLATVRTQVKDLNMDTISPVSTDISIKTAWNVMKKNNVKVLPVADEGGKLLGIITLSEIAGSYMDALENSILSASNTPLRNIIDTLNAKLIIGNEDNFKTTGKVVIAAMVPDNMEPFIEKGDIVLVGNRKDSQIKAIEIGASCIILTCGGQAESDVLKLVREKGCILIETGYDTFAAARMINQSIPVGFVMTKEKLVCFNINDFVDSIKDRMLQTRYRSYPVIDDNNRVKGFISRYHLISQKKKKVILLDHNEKTQTIDGLEQAEIIEIIDHHRIGDIQTAYPVYFKNETIGSTATLIANMYFENGITPANSIAGILCAAIISDTANFKSPTSTYADRSIASKLAKIVNIDINEFAGELFKAGSSLSGMSPQKVLNYDFKDYIFNKFKLGIGQINSSSPDSISRIKDEMLAYMKEVFRNNNYDMLLLMVTDVINVCSDILFVCRDNKVLHKAFSIEPGENVFHLSGVISRKKQVVPLISGALQNEFM